MEINDRYVKVMRGYISNELREYKKYTKRV